MYIKDLPKEGALKAMAEKYPEFNPDALQSIFWVFRFSNELEKALESHVLRWDLSRCRFLILILLYHHDQGMNPSELAEKLDVTRGNITGVIDTLEKNGLIKRKANPKDRRCFTINLTHKGTTLLEKLLPEHFRRIGKAFGCLSRGEFKTLLSILAKLEKNLVHINAP